jgi:hypothetical protein
MTSCTVMYVRMHSTLTKTVTGVIEAKMEARNGLRGDDIWVENMEVGSQ